MAQIKAVWRSVWTTTTGAKASHSERYQFFCILSAIAVNSFRADPM